jgi:hypothetical protein
MSLRRFIPLLVLTSLSACATPETRLRTGLMSAGLSAPQSACMADRMNDKLSLLQLKRLASLGSLKQKQVTSLSIAEFLHKVRALKDPEILIVTSKAALTCAIDR